MSTRDIASWYHDRGYDEGYKQGEKDTIDKFVAKVNLKYLGVHPDELYEPHYAYNIVNDIKQIAKQMKEGK